MTRENVFVILVTGEQGGPSYIDSVWGKAKDAAKRQNKIQKRGAWCVSASRLKVRHSVAGKEKP